MTAALAAIFLCQLLGESLCRFFALPLPGPVVGMLLLFAYLLARGGQGEKAVPKPLAAVSDQLLGHLSLLFVPAAVGMMRYFDLFSHYALLLTVTLAVSTALTMAATALTFRLLTKKS